VQEQTHNQHTRESCALSDCPNTASSLHRSLVLANVWTEDALLFAFDFTPGDALEAESAFPVSWLVGRIACNPIIFVVLKASSSCPKRAAVHRCSLIGASCSRFIGFQCKINIGGHRKNERTVLSRLIGSGHDDVAIWAAVKYEQFRNLVPRHKLNSVLVDDVLLVRRYATGVNIEADHASYKVRANVLLPGFLRPA